MMNKNIEVDPADNKLAGLQVDLLQKIRNKKLSLLDLEWFLKLSPKEMAKLQNKEAESVAPKELRKFSITIGGKSAKVLMAEIEDKFRLGDYAKSMMTHKSFTTIPKEESIELAIITLRDLGFESSPTFRTFLDTIKKHPKYELCSGEEGPHLRLAYPNQPKGEWIRIAMETIPDSDGNPNVFGVEHDDDGMWLDSFWYDSDETIVLVDLWAVRLRK